MKKISYLSALVGIVFFLSACNREECLKCTTIVSGVSTDQPEICDTDKDVLNAKEEEYKALVADFVNDGWEASVNCVRQ